MPEEEEIRQTSKDLRGKQQHLLDERNLASPMNISNMKDRLLYSSKMNNEASMADWVLKGLTIIDPADNSLIMRSPIPNPPDSLTGHVNYWCPKAFPENFIVEWEFNPYTEKSVCHLGIALILLTMKGVFL